MSLTIDDVAARETLTGKERERLGVLEGLVGKSLRSFVEAGQALVEIRDSGLYREAYATFEDYCKGRWEISRSRAYQLIDATTVAQIVSTTVDTYPSTESQARELAVLRDQPEQMAAVWQSATATAAARERPVTAADVREARKLIVGPAVAAAPEPAPPAPTAPKVAGEDARFELIEDAVSLLKMLPAPEQLVFPEDPGDVEAIGEAIEWFAKWTPQMSRAWKQHTAAVRRLRAA